MVTYAERPWVKNYDRGVPESLEPYPLMPVHEFLRESARQHPDNIALITSVRVPVLGRSQTTMTYAELCSATDALAAALVDMGLRKGDRVSIIMPNIAAFVISYYGVLKAGGVVAAVNPIYPAEKMCHQIDDSDSAFVITISLYYPMIKAIQARTKVKTVIVANVKDHFPRIPKLLFTLTHEKKDGHRIDSLADGDYGFQALLAQYAGQSVDVPIDPETDIALFQYTGGTTGIPKAAMSTHKAIVANTLQCTAVLSVFGVPGEDEVFLGAAPMFHVYGLVAVLNLAIGIGAKIALVINPRDTVDVLDVIHTYHPTIFNGVPAMYNAINCHPRVEAGKVNLRSIRACISGSAPLAPETKQRFEALSGGSLREGFGMSEAPTATHVNPLLGENRTGSIGLPFPDMDMRIVSLEDGVTDVPVGEVGELLMAGPQVMVGYHNMPAETQASLCECNGKIWLYTGDIARMDEDGYFYIVDRKKDMVIVGGFNVYPNNVEMVLKEHPAVAEVAVAGIPHPHKVGQERLKAWIVVKPGRTVTPKELQDFAAPYLANYEIPRSFAFIDALPKTAIGKTLRRELVQADLENAAREAESDRQSVHAVV